MLRGDRYTKLCERWNTPGQAHELTFSCYENRPFFAKDRTCDWLVESMTIARGKHAFDLWAYVIMPNHVHLVIWPREVRYSISGILLSIKQPVSRKAIAYLSDHNPGGLQFLATGHASRPYRFWQKGGGYDRNIAQVDTLVHTIRYIHNNPVRKELAGTPDQWRYSSAADWEGTGSGPVPLDLDSLPMR
jgi:putative transposase